MTGNPKKPRDPRWKRFKGICKRGKVVSLAVSGRGKGVGRFHLRIEPDGQVSTGDRTPEEMNMARAFITFGAKPPAWYAALVDYQLHPVRWLLSKQGFREALLPEQRSLLCVDMAQHVVPIFAGAPDTKPHEVRLIRRALRIAKGYASGKEELSQAFAEAEDAVFRLGTEVKGRRGEMYTTYTSIERSDIGTDALATISNALRFVLQAAPLVVGISSHEIERIATYGVDAAIALDQSQGYTSLQGRQLGPHAAAEALWQGIRLVQALDPAKVCRP